MTTKTYNFSFNVGDSVLVSNPLATFAMKGCVVVEQIAPFDYPTGRFEPKNLVLLPNTRKQVRPTRYVSYLVRFEKSDLHMWATEKCLSKDQNELV